MSRLKMNTSHSSMTADWLRCPAMDSLGLNVVVSGPVPVAGD